MNIALDLFRFVETSIMVSIALFCIFLYIKTRDAFIGRTMGLIIPTSICFLISYSYSYCVKYYETYYAGGSVAKIEWIAYFFAILTIAVIALSITTACRYGLSFYPISVARKRIGIIITISLSIVFLLASVYFVTLNALDNLVDTLITVLWIIYPVGSLASFILAVVMLFYLKEIRNSGRIKLARYFLISFMPQIAYTTLDIMFLKSFTFQFTHISYLTFSLLSFYYITMHYFHSYEISTDVSLDKSNVVQIYGFSDREKEVLDLLMEGKTYMEIGDILYISINTVKSHVKSIYKKCSVSNKVQLLHKIRESHTMPNHLKG